MVSLTINSMNITSYKNEFDIKLVIKYHRKSQTVSTIDTTDNVKKD